MDEPIEAHGEDVGFVVTPSEIADRVAAIDAAVAELTRTVEANPKVPKVWADEYRAFTRRWAIERDSYASWDSRLFATRVIPRLEQFEDSYRQWARDYERKTNLAVRPPKPAPVKDLIPWWAWVAVGAVGYVALRGAKRGR